ncbi:MAG: hypothetical protein Q7R52_03380 [archaeon]|nr:hypothetical protein [archaeon]
MIFLETLENFTSLGEVDLNTDILVFLGFLMIMLFIFAIVVYIYMSLALMITAKRLKIKHAWLAWIPVGNYFLMAKMAKKHWWPALLGIVPFLLLIVSLIFLSNILISIIMLILIWAMVITLTVFTIIWTYKICEARGKPGWWAILTIIPIAGWIWSFIMWGILAWSKK